MFLYITFFIYTYVDDYYEKEYVSAKISFRKVWKCFIIVV